MNILSQCPECWDDGQQQLVGELDRLSLKTGLFEHLELALPAGGRDGATGRGPISPTLLVQNLMLKTRATGAYFTGKKREVRRGYGCWPMSDRNHVTMCFPEHPAAR